MELQKPKCCPVCKGDKMIKHGIKNTKSHGKRQRYMCLDCVSTFYGE